MSVSRRLLHWFLPAAGGVLASSVLLAAASAALSGRLGTPMADLPAPAATPLATAGDTIQIVALGDSLTRGTGDGSLGGYPERVAVALRKQGRKVDVLNLAIDGFETSDLVEKLKQPETRSALSRASLVLVSIGGNDLTHASRGLAQTPSPAAFLGAPGALAGALSSTRANLELVLRSIRERNPSAPVRLIGLYNPMGDLQGPSSGAPSPLAALANVPRQVLLGWNVALQESALQVPGSVFVPVADLFEARPDRVSPDRFHPGPTGYDEIATRVVSTLPKALVGS